jgi:DNA-directed RNA polymerase subunit RPC12/RpoP
MVDKKVPMLELHCLNGKCGRTFVVEQGIFVENKRREECPHCGHQDIYPLKKTKLLK